MIPAQSSAIDNQNQCANPRKILFPPLHPTCYRLMLDPVIVNLLWMPHALTLSNNPPRGTLSKALLNFRHGDVHPISVRYCRKLDCNADGFLI